MRHNASQNLDHTETMRSLDMLKFEKHLNAERSHGRLGKPENCGANKVTNISFITSEIGSKTQTRHSEFGFEHMSHDPI